jgi:hypothetical protein
MTVTMYFGVSNFHCDGGGASATTRHYHVMPRRLITGEFLFLSTAKTHKSNVDGDTTLTLGLELVKNPSVLEGRLAELGGLLLELLDGTL